LKTADKKAESLHKSVLLAETLGLLEPADGSVYTDATLGLGGHTEALLEAAECRVIGIDQDREALALAAARLARFGERVSLIHANFAAVKQVLKEAGTEQVDGIIADLGVSSLQLDQENRGFSFRFDAPLDMRMNPDGDDETAAELLERLTEEEIADVIYNYGEERFSRRIARRITERRRRGEPVRTTFELAELVKRSVPFRRKDKIHPATRTFQALRIAVNREIEILEGFLRDGAACLKPDGRLVVITFHSIEDRIVKRTMQNMAGRCFCPPKFPQCVCGAESTVEILTRKPLVPDAAEQAENPRARSAKLRACRKI
jgi:16S rRNA (cytosine1402-N4)-methyltransferase